MIMFVFLFSQATDVALWMETLLCLLICSHLDSNVNKNRRGRYILYCTYCIFIVPAG